MQVDSENKVTIIGGGYAGLAAAVALHKVGVPSVVLERAPSPQSQGFSIGAHSNAWRALEELGVADAVRKGHLRTQRWEYLDNHDTIIKAFQIKDMPPPPGKSMHELRVIRRLASPEALVAALPPNTVQYGVKVAAVRLIDTGAEVELEGGRKHRAKMVVCADGVHSKTAAKYHKAPLQFTKIIGWRAIVDMDCDDPADPQLCEPVIRVASGPNARVGWLPVSYNAAAKKLTWYMFLATPGGLKDYNGDAAQQKQYWLDLVKGWHLPLYQRLVEAAQPSSILKSHIYQRQVRAGRPWFEGCMTGIGDSAHATRPDLGQGGAMALEGGVELGVCMKRAMEEAGKPFRDLSPGEVATALRRFEVLRSHRVAHIINKSQFMALFFWATGFLPLWLMRLVQGFMLSPRTLFEHAMWTPSGSLTPPSLPSAHLANGSAH